MQKTEEFIENRIKWRASKHDLPNKSVFLFENLANDKKAEYLTHFNEEDCGKIILLFTDSKKNWTAIGTKKIIGFDGSEFNSVELNSIKEVDSKNRKEYFEKAKAGATKLKKIKKRNESELLIAEFNGKETIFITKKGSDLFSLWNIIMMIEQLNKKTGYNNVYN
ncbi:hypothetical protein HNV10_16685 [Winogradskyella litoriviva]|uniref:Uncharacterized protein n=1 Tax=Winogradskyella litoriviva TaxID=1220182 RepID=A0ABX2E9Z1_9FLAO|nr:hypothetical protein [Winogradskyella litoriviva]NRD24893.1 hypothetical protein [Winogradskyella litoriviva]